MQFLYIPMSWKFAMKGIKRLLVLKLLRSEEVPWSESNESIEKGHLISWNEAFSSIESCSFVTANFHIFFLTHWLTYGGSGTEWSACQTHNPAVLGSSPALTTAWMFLGSLEFKSSATLVNSQLVCLRPVGILYNVVFSMNYLFQLLARPH